MTRTRSRMLGITLLGALALAGCEDDPILQPTDGGKTGGGSYGQISSLAPAPGGGSGEQTNPETF